MLDEQNAARLAAIILAVLHREYPYHLVHAVSSATEVRPPRELTPAFFGSFDWHSSVHSHWALIRLIRLFPDAPWNFAVRDAVDQDLTAENLAAEVDYQSAPRRAGFERPYGLAWLLQLASELHAGSVDSQMGRWSSALEPLTALAVSRLSEWLPRLSHPIRSGEHSQTAFAMGLALDWARTVQHGEFDRLLTSRALDFYQADRNAPVDYEPSGHDFLSPILGEADLMRRVLPPAQFASWLTAFLPRLQSHIEWLRPVASTDPSDGKLSHLDGLNLSRAWMLEGIAAGLPRDDARRPTLETVILEHAAAGLEAVTDEHYAGAHWLGSFAVYLTTHAGCRT